jgi:BolA protein
MTMAREAKIRAVIDLKLSPVYLAIKDQSHLHTGHAGARDGKGHFDLTVVSERFTGQNNLNRHRMVYDALAQLLQTDIHAVRIKALAPDER